MFTGIRARWFHIRSIGKPWWFLVGGAWGAFWTTDAVIAKYGNYRVKNLWDTYTLHFPLDWKIGVIGFLAILVTLLCEGSFRRYQKIVDDYQNVMKREDTTLLAYRPVITPASYGRRSPGSFGLFVCSDSYPAYDVSAQSVNIGASGARLNFDGILARFTDKDGKQFFEARISYADHSPTVDGGELWKEMLNAGVFTLDIPIQYKDARLNWWQSTVRIRLEAEWVGVSLAGQQRVLMMGAAQ